MDIETLRRAVNQELTNRGQRGLDRFGRIPQQHAPRPARHSTPRPSSATTHRPQPPRERRTDAPPIFVWSLLLPGISQLIQGRWRVGFGFLAAAWLGWALGAGWIVHIVAAAEAAWHEYV
jgi:hypothetical protein